MSKSDLAVIENVNALLAGTKVAPIVIPSADPIAGTGSAVAVKVPNWKGILMDSPRLGYAESAQVADRALADHREGRSEAEHGRGFQPPRQAGRQDFRLKACSDRISDTVTVLSLASL